MTKSQVLAASLLYVFRAHAQTAIYSGTGFGTYYYNIGQTNACGSDFAAQNEGFVECSPLAALSLNQINSEYLVAMNYSQLVGNMVKYCGKRVIVSVDGVPSSLPLFIGDGCKRCSTGSSSIWDPNGALGLDFSYGIPPSVICQQTHAPMVTYQLAGRLWTGRSMIFTRTRQVV
jgi:hypothetical protein